MLPFVLLVGPPLIRAISSAFPGLVSEDIKSSALRGEALRKSFSLAMIVPGLVMLLIGLAVTLEPHKILSSGAAPSALILGGMQVMFLGSGAILFALGAVIFATGRFIGRTE